jgi:hypothetical protein
MLRCLFKSKNTFKIKNWVVIGLLACYLVPLIVKSQTNQNRFEIKGCINQYDSERYNLLTNQLKFDLTNSKLQKTFLQSNWEIQTISKIVPGKTNATDYTVTFICKKGILKQSSVSIDIVYSKWSEKNYVLLPAAAYNGNRFAWRRLRYSPKLHDIKDIGPDKPIIINDVPKLSENGGVSRIQERSGSMSTPSVGYYSDSLHHAVWMLTEQGNSLGDYGINVEESRNRKKATISITSPVVREQYNYISCNARNPSWDIPKDFKAGDKVVIHFRLYQYQATKLQDLFDGFCDIRKDVIPNNPSTNTLPYSACLQTMEQKYNQQNFVEKYGYYSIGMRENFLQDWQIGWTGGMITTLPLLFAENEQTKKNVIRNFDWLFPNGISPSGFFWDAGQKGTEWLGGDIRNAHTKNWHLIRKSGDAVWYITKQFILMEKMGITVKQTWKDGNQKVCDAFVQLWKKNHQIGQFIDSQTGEIIVGGSSSGAIVPAALSIASQYYHNPLYLETAKEIAEYFNLNFTQKGISCGGPGDALQSMDSESAEALVESYVSLFESTYDKKWLAIAENAAKQFATWVVSYNYLYPDTTAFFKANIHTMGGVYANIQNKHSAPGICSGSGIGLLKLYRYTGNTFYSNLLKDIAHNIPQYLPHPKKPLGNAPFGWVSERINMTDWEGPQSIGYILPISTWAETSLMLTTVEIPGLYVQTDKATFIAFDNIEAKIIKETDSEWTLELTNTTAVDAMVSLLEENASSSIKNLGENSLYGCKKISIKAGTSTTISFHK